jgi:transcriptional regulator with XRE-family HTH domain
VQASELVRRARTRSGLTQRQLARRAGTSAAAICQYESGAQVPGFDTLVRIVEAAGSELHCQVTPRPSQADVERNAEVLAQVIALAEALPHAARAPLRYPPFAASARPTR